LSTIINGTSSAITFPDSSVQNTSAIVSGYVPYANLPAGSVLQVVSATTTTVYSTSSTSWTAATNFAVTITPKYSTSKIMVLMFGGMIDNNGIGSQVSATIYRNNTTNLAPGAGGNDKGMTEVYGQQSRLQIPFAISYVDSPATTSATTYTLYYKGNGTTAYISSDSNQAQIIAMEIAA